MQPDDLARVDRAPLGPAFRLAGRPGCRHAADGRWRDLPAKGAALLLFVAAEGSASRSRLCRMLWPDGIGGRPRASLRSLLRDLRQLSGGDLVLGGETLTLAPGVEHDLAAFAGPVPEAEAVPTQELLAGVDLAGVEEFEGWLDGCRLRWRAVAGRRLSALAAAQAEAGRGAQALATAQRLAVLLPQDEAANRLLMRQLARQGRRDDALAVYRQLTAALAASAGRAPAAITLALAAAIEMGDAVEPAAGVGAAPAGLPATLRLAGRAADLAALRGARAAGRHLLLEGEPGIGKTRLFDQLETETPAAVRITACQGDADVPYQLALRLLRALAPRWRRHWPLTALPELSRLYPELGQPPARPARFDRVAEAFDAMLRGCRAHGLDSVLVEDLHWADGPSLRLLLAATRSAQGPGWVTSCRSGQRPPALDDALAAGAASWYVQVLEPMDPAGVRNLLAGLPFRWTALDDWAHWCQARALGNPLHVLETVRGLQRAAGDGVFTLTPPGDEAGLPPTLAALVVARVARLADDERHLAQLVALAGPAFSAPLARQVLGLHELALGRLWDALERGAILRDGALAHDSLRDALLDGLPAEVARALHARVAALGADLGVPDADLARHWWQAGDWAACARASARAAEHAAVLGARGDECGLWDQVADCHDRLSAAESAFAARLRAFEAARDAEAVDRLETRAAALQAQARSDTERVDAASARAWAACLRSRWDEALAAIDDAAALLPASAAVTPRALRLHGLRAQALASLRRFDEALALVERHRAALEALPDDGRRLEVTAAFGFALAAASRLDAAEALFTAALDLARRLDDPAEAMTMASNLSVALVRRGDLAQAHALCDEIATCRRRVGAADGLSSASSRMSHGVIALRRGCYDEALDQLQQARAGFEAPALAAWRAVCETHLATVYRELGRTDLARAALTPWPENTVLGRAMRGWLLVTLDVADGRPPDGAAQAALEAELAVAQDSTRYSVEIGLCLLLPPAAALQRAEAMASSALAQGWRAAEQGAWFAQCDALRRAGRAAEALPRLRAALARLDGCHPAELTTAQAWTIAWQVFADAGLADDAGRALRSGQTWLREQALPHVPSAFRRSFGDANPVHRRLLTAR